MRQVGPGYVFNRVANTTAPLALILTLPADTTQEFIVQAVNHNLQSVPSDPVAITIPPAISAPAAETKRSAASAPAVAAGPASKSNGNAKANGNGDAVATARAQR